MFSSSYEPQICPREVTRSSWSQTQLIILFLPVASALLEKSLVGPSSPTLSGGSAQQTVEGAPGRKGGEGPVKLFEFFHDSWASGRHREKRQGRQLLSDQQKTEKDEGAGGGEKEK